AVRGGMLSRAELEPTAVSRAGSEEAASPAGSEVAAFRAGAEAAGFRGGPEAAAISRAGTEAGASWAGTEAAAISRAGIEAATVRAGSTAWGWVVAPATAGCWTGARGFRMSSPGWVEASAAADSAPAARVRRN